MKTTTSFSVAARTVIPLVYQCEYCGSEVSMRYPMRSEFSIASRGSATSNWALRKQFEEAKDSALSKKIEEDLNSIDERFNRKRQYYCLDGFISAGKCPHCKKKQSWHRLSNYAEKKAVGGWIGGLAGFSLGTAIYTLGQNFLSFPGGLVVVLVIAAAVIVGVISGIALGKRQSKKQEKQFAEWISQASEAQIPRLLVLQHGRPTPIDASVRGMYDL